MSLESGSAFGSAEESWKTAMPRVICARDQNERVCILYLRRFP